ncbi:HNH endonuclease [Flavobacteriaceae bacterium S356]|uniref:HNH endonuclease n=1 Tax=Asprobacillus argus TaxID=3076534 RepID=A0ABU3LDJ5_9FLAO|nr:HNH endonuclease [Flavobacteriaceae bacterium S356]
MNPPKLSQGDILSNDDIVEQFGCGNTGGMRRSHKTNTLVIVSDHTKGLYDDVWHDNVMHYTGMGPKGNQSKYYKQNRTLLEQKSNGISVHLFEVYKQNNYVYQGEVILSGEPYQKRQLDKENKPRLAWMFPVTLLSGTPFRFKETDIQNVQTQKLKEVRKLSDEELKEAIENTENRGKSNKKQTVSTSYVRDVKVVEYALRRAKGYCQLCDKQAPFNRKGKNGAPFLEVHHIQYLSKGGTDTIDNVAALCPNCHRKMHALEDKKDVRKLKRVAVE